MGSSKQYDLAVIGNGIAAKMSLFYLAQSLKNTDKFKDYSILNVFDEKLAPACSLKTTSTVSLNGIKEGVSELGDELREAFFHFCDFYKHYHPAGIYPSKQYLFATSIEGIEKLRLRYTDDLSKISHPLMKGLHHGVVLDSFIIIPEVFLAFLDAEISRLNITTQEDFVLNINESEDQVLIETKSHATFKAKKLLLGTGAYTKIFQDIFLKEQIEESFFDRIDKSKVVSGSYLLFEGFEHDENFYFTFDDINVVYRKNSKELIIGSTTVEGAYLTPVMHRLFEIYHKVKSEFLIEIPSFDLFKIVTGLRHKGMKRRPFSAIISKEKRIHLMGGLYKNGWSLPFYYGKRDLKFILEN